MKLNQIPEVMLEKKQKIGHNNFRYNRKIEGFNEGNTAQGEVEVEIDTKKAAVLLYENKLACLSAIAKEDREEAYYNIAEAFSDNLPKILRRKQ